MIRACLFDMDGVLIQNAPIDFVAWTEALRKYGIKTSREELRTLAGTPSQGIIEYFNERSGGELPKSLLEEKRELFYTVAEQGVQKMPDIEMFLDTLLGKGKVLAVVSASEPKRIEVSLRKTGLAMYFRIVMSGEEVKNNKPFPDAYMAAAAALNIAPEDCAVFEDSITGIKAGKAAGMRVFGYTSSYPGRVLEAAGADVTFSSFRELLRESEIC